MTPSTQGTALPHSELRALRSQLQSIYDSIPNVKPHTIKLPILDSSLESTTDTGEDTPWLQQDQIHGMKKLVESVRVDLDFLDKFLDNPESKHRPPLSTNAPYLIAVWNEILCASAPVTSIFRSFPLLPQDKLNATKRRTGQKPQGTKVDIVADDGRQWIRVNTIKNVRLLSEFREMDSYLTDSDDDPAVAEAIDNRQSLAPLKFDNSVLKMGRTLVETAKMNPIEGTSEIPKVTLCLTRLDLSPINPHDYDPRLTKTVKLLEELGIEVRLGPRGEVPLASSPLASAEGSTRSSPTIPLFMRPSHRVNLDLSILIALVSDLTHAPLPSSVEDAQKRFIPPKSYREWKQKRLAQFGKMPSPTLQDDITDVGDMPQDLVKLSRALTNQFIQEMSRGIIQEIHDKLLGADDANNNESVEFWTTSEARYRCLRIISKIGGPNEKRRAHALFYDLSQLFPGTCLSATEAQSWYWRGSRYPHNYIPLLPIRIFPASEIPTASPDLSWVSDLTDLIGRDLGLEKNPSAMPYFFRALTKTCKDILSQELIPHPRALPDELVNPPTSFLPQVPDEEYGRPLKDDSNAVISSDSVQSLISSTSTHTADTYPSSPPTSSSSAASIPTSMSNALPFSDGEIQRAIVTKANPKLTAHTVQSLLYGSELGWTTLTGNRSSVKAMLKEYRAARISGRLVGIPPSPAGGSPTEENRTDAVEVAAIWVVDPRSLAEGMSSFALP